MEVANLFGNVTSPPRMARHVAGEGDGRALHAPLHDAVSDRRRDACGLSAFSHHVLCTCPARAGADTLFFVTAT